MHVSMLMALTLALAAAVPARAADLQVIAGGGIAVPLNEIVAQFEQTSGHKVTDPLRHRAGADQDRHDHAVRFRRHAERSLQGRGRRGATGAGPTIDIAHVGLGVAVHSGAPKPDIGTPEALKQALLAAKTVATIPASAAGAQVMKLFERLGVARRGEGQAAGRRQSGQAGRDHGRRPGRDRHLHHQRADGQRHGRGGTGAGRARLRADLYQRHRARRRPGRRSPERSSTT